jgi:uncharacterized membrane protein
MRRGLDGVLNGVFVLGALVFLTGGAIYRDPRITVDLARLDVLGALFLLLLGLRRLLVGDGDVRDLACLRLLGGLGERLAHAPRAVYAVAALWSALLIAVAVRRHHAFESAAFDLGIFDQALWNTAHGRLLFSSIKGDTTLLGDHLDPLQLVLVPFYWLAPSPLVPLVAQGLALALGAVPLYWLARARFPGSVLAPLFPLLYLLYLPLRAVNRFDYHPTAFVPALLLLALYCLEREQWSRLVGCLVLAGLCKENVPAAGIGVGLYLVVARRRWRLGLALCLAFGLWLYAGPVWIIPAFNPDGYAYFARYQWGDGALDLLSGRRLLYLWHLLAPVAFLPLLAPARILPGLPFLAQNLLAAAEAHVSLDYHYTAELVPYVFYAAVGGAGVLVRWGAGADEARRHRLVAAGLVAAALLFHDRPEPFHLRRYHTTPHLDELRATLRALPPEAVVSAQNRIVPHLAHRPYVYVFPDLGPRGQVRAEYVVLDQTLDRWPIEDRFDAEVAALAEKGYVKLVERGGILLFRREP